MFDIESHLRWTTRHSEDVRKSVRENQAGRRPSSLRTFTAAWLRRTADRLESA